MTTSIKTTLSAITLSLALTALPIIWLDIAYRDYTRAWTHGAVSIEAHDGRDAAVERYL